MVSNFFAGSTYYTGPILTDGMVRQAEAQLGVRLPRAYVSLLRERNGGEPRNRCFPTRFPTSWAVDHFCIEGVFGIGDYPWGIDSELGSRYLAEEWGYPHVGVIFCSTSFEHDAVMFDYTQGEDLEEPPVVYIDRDRKPRRVARSFNEFIEGLRSCDEFDDD
ncbi:SMI1/KNR4 family protein [Saccharomonospora iraqiensis]|uniref:SMI1/KNR4 family protein n=1 Tax=Saccharomonospora iraqiensis TaxID=52698 RepID=UPI001F2947B4|nr:SMI1/KNR4 family protein [Saccharomonospora iraqiensis]